MVHKYKLDFFKNIFKQSIIFLKFISTMNLTFFILNSEIKIRICLNFIKCRHYARWNALIGERSEMVFLSNFSYYLLKYFL